MDTTEPTRAEMGVMELLWERGQLTARQIREALFPKAEKAQHGTVQRFLQSLEAKGCVVRDRTLPVHLFEAALDREAFAGRQLEALAERLTGGSMTPFLTHLVSERKLDATELDRLRAMIDAASTEEQDHG